MWVPSHSKEHAAFVPHEYFTEEQASRLTERAEMMAKYCRDVAERLSPVRTEREQTKAAAVDWSDRVFKLAAAVPADYHSCLQAIASPICDQE